MNARQGGAVTLSRHSFHKSMIGRLLSFDLILPPSLMNTSSPHNFNGSTTVTTSTVFKAAVVETLSIFFGKQVRMTRICHNHRQQTNPPHCEKETQNTDSQMAIKINQPSLPRQDGCKTRKNTKNFAIKQVPSTSSHSQWEQHQGITTTESRHKNGEQLRLPGGGGGGLKYSLPINSSP